MAERSIYGPVPSRRLGRSLGVDPIPLKTCNWNCVYCQLGRTRPLTIERRRFRPTEDILRELEGTLEHQAPDAIDWITIVGSGEPLLELGIGDLVRGIQALSDLPLAVITNGSLLSLPEVRDALLPVQAVLPTLDAGSARLFRRINRPHPRFGFEAHVRGLVDFRDAYRGRLLVEVMLLEGVNDTPDALADLAEVLRRISPDEIHILVPTRPPVEEWVRPPDAEGIGRVAEALSAVAPVILPHSERGGFERSSVEAELAELTEILRRHPMTDAEVGETLERWAPGRAREILETLRRSGKVRSVVRGGRLYWVSRDARFPGES